MVIFHRFLYVYQRVNGDVPNISNIFGYIWDVLK